MEGSAEVEEMQEAKREGERVAWERERGQLLGEAEVPTHACKRKHSTHARTHARMHACMHACMHARTHARAYAYTRIRVYAHAGAAGRGAKA